MVTAGNKIRTASKLTLGSCIFRFICILSLLRPSHLIYFFPFLAAFFASSSCFAAKRAGDLYGRFDVFFFGLNAIIRVIASSI